MIFWWPDVLILELCWALCVFMGEAAQKFISGESEDEAETSHESTTNKANKEKNP